MPSLNVKRIESDIEKYIPLIIQRECHDELIKTITITSCKLSKDFSYCKVYFTSLSPLSKKEIEKEVNEASSFIRGKLANLIDARSIPFLEFTYDESIEYGNKIENIIKKIHEKDNKDSLD